MIKIVFRCPKSQVKRYRYRKIAKGKQRIGGCAIPRARKFAKIKEIKTIKNRVKYRRA